MKFSKFSLFLLLGICSCSKLASPSRQPEEFVKEISQADRMVATNIYLAISRMITNPDVATVKKAITSAKHDDNAYSAEFDWHIQFYAGTNFLNAIRLQDDVFWAGNLQYSDDTGILKALYKSLGRSSETN